MKLIGQLISCAIVGSWLTSPGQASWAQDGSKNAVPPAAPLASGSSGSERPKSRALDILAQTGVGTRRFGSDVGGEWSHDWTKSPIARLALGYEFNTRSPWLRFQGSVDLTLLHSREQISSPRGAAEIESDAFLYGFTLGPALVSGIDDRWGLTTYFGLNFSFASSRRTLRSAKFSTRLEPNAGDSLLLLGASGFYRLAEPWRLVIGYHGLGTLNALVAGVSYDL